MNQWKRLIYYLLINVIVSACTTLVVLTVWDRLHSPQTGQAGILSFSTGSRETATISATSPLTSTTSLTLTLPTAAPTIDKYEDAEAYQVKENDTLGLIADRYETTVEELLEFNGLKDKDALSVGQVIYIPVTPEVVPTMTPAPTKAAGGTGTPGAPPVEAGVVINSVIGVGDLSAEHVFITRTGSGLLTLVGWQLTDEDGNVYSFPQLDLYENGGVNVWTTSGTTTVVDLYWSMQRPVWQSGEKVTLKDGQGKVRATYTIP